MRAFVFLLVALVLVTAVPQPAAAAGYGICAIDKCAGAVAAAGGGCATFVGFAVAPNYEICTSAAGAAGGAISLTVGVTTVSGYADVVGEATDVDVCADTAPIEISLVISISCTAATSAFGEGCVQANAKGSATSALGVVSTPMAGASFGCASAGPAMRLLSMVLGKAEASTLHVDTCLPPACVPLSWDALPPETQQEIREEIRASWHQQVEAQTLAWPEGDLADALRDALLAELDAQLDGIGGVVHARAIGA